MHNTIESGPTIHKKQALQPNSIKDEGEGLGCSFGEMPQWVEKLKQMNGNFACKDEDEGTEDLSASLVVEIAEKIFLWKQYV
ncbi:hypothetical protein GOBAR_AA39331 [Gossypium barbadense]|uniref:Uncharacterized protein n=1 Tax=Gossypium barbadense TaxID=3634 RepID=A0A2P5VRB5_GOSBA|nr:hypothetical protein GOBAR_AA39331 [Gossypium barbadense]